MQGPILRNLPILAAQVWNASFHLMLSLGDRHKLPSKNSLMKCGCEAKRTNDIHHVPTEYEHFVAPQRITFGNNVGWRCARHRYEGGSARPFDWKNGEGRWSASCGKVCIDSITEPPHTEAEARRQYDRDHGHKGHLPYGLDRPRFTKDYMTYPKRVSSKQVRYVHFCPFPLIPDCELGCRPPRLGPEHVPFKAGTREMGHVDWSRNTGRLVHQAEQVVFSTLVPMYPHGWLPTAQQEAGCECNKTVGWRKVDFGSRIGVLCDQQYNYNQVYDYNKCTAPPHSVKSACAAPWVPTMNRFTMFCPPGWERHCKLGCRLQADVGPRAQNTKNKLVRRLTTLEAAIERFHELSHGSGRGPPTFPTRAEAERCGCDLTREFHAFHTKHKADRHDGWECTRLQARPGQPLPYDRSRCGPICHHSAVSHSGTAVREERVPFCTHGYKALCGRGCITPFVQVRHAEL